MDNVETLVAQAREQATARQFDAAAKLAKQALKVAPDDPSARLAMVFVRYQEKRINPLEKAIASALEVVTDPVDRARCHAYLSYVYTYYTGPEWWWTHAVAHARRAVEQAPDYHGGHFALALALEKRHRWAAAVNAIDIACSLHADPGYFREQTRLREKQTWLARQIEEARADAAAQPTAAHWIRLSSLHGYQDQFDQAFAALDRAAAADPKEKHVGLWRKYWMVESGRTPVTLTLKTEPKQTAARRPAGKQASVTRSPKKPARPATKRAKATKRAHRRK